MVSPGTFEHDSQLTVRAVYGSVRANFGASARHRFEDDFHVTVMIDMSHQSR
jgi:hypothetical protein